MDAKVCESKFCFTFEGCGRCSVIIHAYSVLMFSDLKFKGCMVVFCSYCPWLPQPSKLRPFFSSASIAQTKLYPGIHMQICESSQERAHSWYSEMYFWPCTKLAFHGRKPECSSLLREKSKDKDKDKTDHNSTKMSKDEED